MIYFQKLPVRIENFMYSFWWYLYEEKCFQTQPTPPQINHSNFGLDLEIQMKVPISLASILLFPFSPLLPAPPAWGRERILARLNTAGGRAWHSNSLS